jgi:outer membrane protein OmpA-like peptidoglycan-associated protein
MTIRTQGRVVVRAVQVKNTQVALASTREQLKQERQDNSASLDQVAEALKAQDADKRMVVEGHTDSQGSDKTAVGMGSTRPIVDNSSAENRANNRRVEIIISPGPISKFDAPFPSLGSIHRRTP